MALDVFEKKVEAIGEEYADLINETIKAKKQDKTLVIESLGKINEGITILNHIACTLERINRLQHERDAGGSSKE